MIKKQNIFTISSLFILFTLISVFVLPSLANAQMSEGQTSWSDREDIRQWRERNSIVSSRISSLDPNKVLDIPVPILFGLTPENLTRNFGDARSNGRLHEGLDIMAPLRALIVSPTQAVVIRTGFGESAGHYVYTANPGGETFVYLHLDEIADIKEGDILQKGDLIGYVGNTGNASGGSPHLHFEIQYNGVASDPFPRLTRVFPLADKIEYLKAVLNKKSPEDQKKISENMVSLYHKELVLAQTLNVSLPPAIAEILGNKVISETVSITRTLRVGLQGEDVKALQTMLGVTADGGFGPKTKAALVVFQTNNNLTPDGIFGPATRAVLTGRTLTYPIGCTPLTRYSTMTGLRCTAVVS